MMRKLTLRYAAWHDAQPRYFRLTVKYVMQLFGLLLVLLGLFGFEGCKLRRNAGETDAQFKARQQAVFIAQATLGVDKWSDAVEALGNGGAIETEARRIQYGVNEQVLSGLDIVRERLRNPVTGDALAKLKGVLFDLREAQRREVVKIKNAEVRAQVDAIFEISLFALESLQAVLEESKQPSRADVEEKAETIKRRAGIPGYLVPLISLAREAGFEALRISRLTTPDAYARAEALSLALHSKNAARLAALPA